jgi:endonuclease/exonuclease/phosphatase family metal-dependent hydrolase
MRHRAPHTPHIRSLLLAAYPLALVGLSAVHTIAPQRRGILAVSQIGAPYLFLPLFLVLPWAFAQQMWLLRWSLLMCGAIFCIRFMPTLVSFPTLETPDVASISVMTWNTLFRNDEIRDFQQVLADAPTSVIALQELSPKQAQTIVRDQHIVQRYPYQILRPDTGARGMALLSMYPILEQGTSFDPNMIWARVRLDDSRTVVIMNTHPPASRIRAIGNPPLVLGYDPSERDRQIMGVRKLVAPLLAQNEPVLLVGDFNVTEREPAYDDLTAGLQDAQRAVGWGAGNSWRRWPSWSFGLLRIDYLLSNKRVTPLRTSTDCTPRGSDHCIVTGVFEVQ